MLANFGGNKVNAQIDTLFWFAAPWVTPDHDGNVQLAFRISTFGAPANAGITQLPETFQIHNPLRAEERHGTNR